MIDEIRDIQQCIIDCCETIAKHSLLVLMILMLFWFITGYFQDFLIVCFLFVILVYAMILLGIITIALLDLVKYLIERFL